MGPLYVYAYVEVIPWGCAIETRDLFPSKSSVRETGSMEAGRYSGRNRHIFSEYCSFDVKIWRLGEIFKLGV